MKIMVTGANGFLGSELINQFRETNHTILPLVRHKRNIGDIICDIRNPNELLKSLNYCKSSVIINCAAKVDFSDSTHKEQYETNALAPSIMQAAKNQFLLLRC